MQTNIIHYGIGQYGQNLSILNGFTATACSYSDEDLLFVDTPFEKFEL